MKIFVVLACLALAYTYADDEKDDKCLAGYKACAAKIDDSAPKSESWKKRTACGKVYLKCRKSGFIDGIKDRDCIKKCEVAYFVCVKKGGKKTQCKKKAEACVKACKQ